MKPDEIIKKFNIDAAVVRKTVQHCDVMRFDNVGKMVKTDEGYLKGTAPIAKVGVMTYLLADGQIINEFVPAETLFDEDSMASLSLKPITDNHPSEKRITSENAGYKSIGVMGEKAEKQDVYLVPNMVIMDGYSIDKIMQGKQELSPGYECELVFQQGTYDGKKYDAIQLKRKYNHLAVVDNARGGMDIRMKLDGKDNFGYESSLNQIKKENRKMNKIQLDGIEYEAAQEVINYCKKLQQTVDTAATTLKTATDAKDTLQAAFDALKVKHDALDKRDVKKDVADGVKARVALERLADSLGVKVDKIDEMDNRALSIEIVKGKQPKLAEKINKDSSDAYIQACLDGISLTPDPIAMQRQVTGILHNTDGKEMSADAARKRYMDNLQNDSKPKTEK